MQTLEQSADFEEKSTDFGAECNFLAEFDFGAECNFGAECVFGAECDF